MKYSSDTQVLIGYCTSWDRWKVRPKQEFSSFYGGRGTYEMMRSGEATIMGSAMFLASYGVSLLIAQEEQGVHDDIKGKRKVYEGACLKKTPPKRQYRCEQKKP
jgi:hypothetical protein